ncbi:formate/nitrite transporter FocA (FNT family) [Virgibacillus halotolerans]|uniref:sporulation protein YpjB n=1 Tax=Virgibacillus halotolerans TaxID=1071053 RepID=UPI00195F591B|nr:formate/nitrite transporter FocA (FNT family) [Virgibacillus halotolerans]
MANRCRYIRFFFILFIGIFIFLHTDHSIAASPTAPTSSETSTENTDLGPLLWSVLFIGGSIAITLSYVSWRKYRGEVKKGAKKDKSVD